MEPIEMFRQLRDACDEIIKAMENDDVEAMELVMGKFMVLMMKFDAVK